MRIFDVYEHPSFQVENSDKAAMQTIIRRLGVGATVSALAAIGFWGYYRSDSSSNMSVLTAIWPTGIRKTYHSVLEKGNF